MKNVLGFTFLLVANVVSAQFKLGCTAGINFANQKPVYTMYFNGQPKKIYGKSIINFNAGVSADLAVTKKIMIRPHILYSGEGFEAPHLTDAAGLTIISQNKVNLSYMNIPVQAVYTTSFSFGNLFIGSGPYLGILLGGKMKMLNSNTNIHIGNNPGDDFKGLDMGLYNSLGIQFKNRLFIQGSYNLGLMDVNPNFSNNKNSVISVGIGYR